MSGRRAIPRSSRPVPQGAGARQARGRAVLRVPRPPAAGQPRHLDPDAQPGRRRTSSRRLPGDGRARALRDRLLDRHRHRARPLRRRSRHNRFTDQLIRVFSLVGISIPTFWLALACLLRLLLPAALGARAPGGSIRRPTPPPHGHRDVHGRRAARRPVGHVRRCALAPRAAGARAHALHGRPARPVRPLGRARRARARTTCAAARAKGLPARTRRVPATCCAARSLPILTIVGLAFGSLLSGTVLTEQVFSWGGIGQYAYKAATTLDLPAVMGVGLVVGIVYIGINFIIDVVYGFIDPRVRVHDRRPTVDSSASSPAGAAHRPGRRRRLASRCPAPPAGRHRRVRHRRSGC